jgi:hypothetical protein
MYRLTVAGFEGRTRGPASASFFSGPSKWAFV